MNEKRIKEIVQALKLEKVVSSSTICKNLNITSRTLRTDIKESKKYLLSKGIEIQSFPAVGYKLIIHDSAKFNHYLFNEAQEQSNNYLLVPTYPEDRVDYLVRLFLMSNDYLKSDDIAERMYISKSTLTIDLKSVREKLKYFHLDLVSVPNMGMRVEGSEFHKRSAIANYCFNTDSIDEKILSKTQKTEEQKKISKLLYEILCNENFYLTDAGFEGLVIHIMIAFIRIKKSAMNNEQEVEASICVTREYEIAMLICDKLEQEFSIKLPKIERYYITMHLAGKQAAQYQLLNDAYQDIIDETLNEINKKLNIDLTFDMDLMTSLSLHLSPLMNRLKYDMIIQNPLLDKIKQANSTAFEMGVIFAYIVEKNYGFKMSDSEIGYVSLHFELAIERYKKRGSKKNVIIICASGLGSSQILQYKIRNKFKDYINYIYVTQLYALKDVDQAEFDFILSTVPVPFKTKIPVIRIQYFFDDTDVQNLTKVLKDSINNRKESFVTTFFRDELIFTDILLTNKKDIIHEMCQRTSKYIKLNSDYENQVLKREDYASTEFGNMVAMPHPMVPVAQPSFVALSILKKPVHWMNKNIKYIFLLSLEQGVSETYTELYESLAALCFDEDALRKIEKEPSVDTICAVFDASSQETESLDDLFSK